MRREERQAATYSVLSMEDNAKQWLFLNLHHFIDSMNQYHNMIQEFRKTPLIINSWLSIDSVWSIKIHVYQNTSINNILRLALHRIYNIRLLTRNDLQLNFVCCLLMQFDYILQNVFAKSNFPLYTLFRCNCIRYLAIFGASNNIFASK